MRINTARRGTTTEAHTRMEDHTARAQVDAANAALHAQRFARLDESAEWIETDGLGGFAMGTATGVRTRRYHSLLTSCLKPPTDRVAFVKGFDAWLQTPDGTYPLSCQRYAGGHVAPDGLAHLAAFAHEPWPRWEYRLPSGLRIVHELVMRRGSPGVALSWRLIGPAPYARLIVRPLLACTPMHDLNRENQSFRFDVHLANPTCLAWKPYPHLPEVFAVATNGAYVHDPVWYRGLYYAEEQRRGFDHLEDLGSPGCFRWDLAGEEAVLLLSAGETRETCPRTPASPAERLAEIRSAEAQRRAELPAPLGRAADAFIVRRGEGRTVLAGYPWFGDWGRDTFIAIRGLCLATGRSTEARQILDTWADSISQGMLPNRFTDVGDTPEFNAVDASLWFVVAAGECLDQCDGWNAGGRSDANARIRQAIAGIVSGYARGTRYGIRMDADGLLAAGEPGVQLTWMDARVGGQEVTPRTGKAVEVQALWINALAMAARIEPSWGQARFRAAAAFRERFWNPERGCLFDVIDADHRPGATDPAMRPNQIFAVGGLPIAVLDGPQARSVVDAVERELLTPLGLRSLARGEHGYCHRYEGGPGDRDRAYHNGTVWPWLMGAFIEAWVRVRGSTPESAREARARFVEPMLAHRGEGGLGGISEIIDAEAPGLPRGCPFQAWSVGELARVIALLDRIESHGP
jgi:predicted glycogen debranching enzyme